MQLRKKSNETLYDAVRKKWVSATPEEAIRQNLIRFMVEQRGYPLKLIAVEKELSTLTPHLASHPFKKNPVKMPKRRVDIVVFSRETLRALLLIECKSIPLTEQFAQQVIGYNSFIGAPFVALANEGEILTGAFDPSLGRYRFISGLPHYSETAQ